MSGQAGWYLVYSKAASGEAKARDALLAAGFPAWLPTCIVIAMHARKLTFVVKPVFSRYLFAQLDPQRGAFGIVRGLGDILLVEFDGKPERVPEQVIRELSFACVSGAFNIIPAQAKPSPKDFAQGMEVRTVDGPFAEFIGKIKRVSHGQRVQVLFDVLGKEMKASVSLDKLLPA